MPSSRQAVRKSGSRIRDGRLRIEDIEAAFTRAGLEDDYQTLVAAVGPHTLAQSMTESWLHLTIRDLLAERARAATSGHDVVLRAAAGS